MEKQERNLTGYLKVTGAGFAMGVANVIPGVSGGTMAFILGIFEELVTAIKDIASVKTFKLLLKGQFKELANSVKWKFLLALFLGIGVALGSASILFVYLLDNYQSMTFAFFFGLILASVVCMLKEVSKWNIAAVIWLLIGAAFAAWLVSMVPASTENNWYLSLGSGAIVICAMILPGISGSFLLLLFGQYNYVWGAVAACSKMQFSLQHISTLFWTGVGAMIGLGAFIHLLNFMLAKFRNVTMATLIGFMAGSLWRLWPWQQTVSWSAKTATGKEIFTSFDAAVAAGEKVQQFEVKNVWPANLDAAFWYPVLLLIAGLVLVLAIEFIAKRKSEN